MQQKATSVNILLDKANKEQIEKNKQQLEPTVDLAMVGGRQNIARKGHCYDSKYLQDDNVNPGNFQELYDFWARCANKDVKICPKNATYRSKTTQNEIISIFRKWLTETLVSENQEAQFFPILADEATDCANIEQMSLVIRFVDRSMTIREELMDLFLANVVFQVRQSLLLSWMQ